MKSLVRFCRHWGVFGYDNYSYYYFFKVGYDNLEDKDETFYCEGDEIPLHKL